VSLELREIRRKVKGERRKEKGERRKEKVKEKTLNAESRSER